MFLGTRDMTSYDLFAYCGNNPVTNTDVNGYVSINLTGVKLTAFIRWIKKIANFWSDGYERRLINVTNGAFTLYLSMSVATTLGKLKKVNVSSNSITISGRGFSTKLGYSKICYTLSKNIGGLTIETAAFVGTKGYGMGLSFVYPIYNLKNKKVGYWAINLVGEVTYVTLAAVAVTIAGACVVMPVITPMAKQLVSSFYALSSPSRIASLAYTFYSLATKLVSRF